MFERAFALCARDPSLVALHRKGALVLATRGEVLVCDDDPSSALAAWARVSDELASRGSARAPFAFGWLGYDAARGDDPSSARDARPRGDLAPLAYLQRIHSWIAIADDGSVRDSGGESPTSLTAMYQRCDGALERIEAHEIKCATDRERHRAELASVREAILDGEVYLVNVARTLHARGGMTDAQIAARVARSRAPYSALLRGPSCTIGAMSMERALAWNRSTDALETRPIKGTRPRDRDPVRDRALADELYASEKERAENVMAVDVHRNDLGRVALVGSVAVDALCAVEPHAFVHHLVSTVRATARRGVGAREVLEAMLPVGSVTGAPKRAAMATIASLEPEKRGLYTGAYGVLDSDGSLDLAVAIRTIVVDSQGAHYGSGGGIVIDSDPDHEWAELAWKERALASPE
ncbi:MAG: anthranilate synthase component I family protein [Myxococcales bacterium]|nr:anthranilate synthase component I family protein [Myxococcales bacterium]